MVPASGRPFDAPADLVAGALHHHRGAFDIEAQSRSLKARPEDFEPMRDHYRYRREYF